MTFLVERIPDDEKSKLSAQIDHYKPDLSTRWVVDRDRDAYVVLISKEGGPYDGTQITKHYVLSWRGSQIYIAADPLKPTYDEAGATMNWRVHSLRYPIELEDRREDLLQIIREAFNSIGEYFDGDRYLSVSVDFDISPVTY